MHAPHARASARGGSGLTRVCGFCALLCAVWWRRCFDLSQDAGGTRFGTIGKRFFKSALGIAFHHYTFTPEIYEGLCLHYGCGDDDRFHGGKMLVAWRDFANDFLAAKKFDALGREVAHAGNDGIAGRGDTGYKFAIPGAQK